MINHIKLWPFWIIPIILLALVTPWISQMDIAISRYFFQEGQFQSNSFLKFVYDFGIYPAWVVIIASCVGLFFAKYRRISIYLLLTILIGSAVITHAVLKDHWGRPRPREITEFGGSKTYKPYYQPNFFDKENGGKSFPSGHVTMGFYFFALMFLGILYRKRWLIFSGLLIALVLGVLLSYTRIAQGGHFISDTLIAGLVMWYVSLILIYIVKPET